MLVENDNVTGSQLSSTQKQRYDLISKVYGDDAEIIVKNVSGKGQKSWGAFLQKMQSIMKAKAAEMEYYDALYEAIELEQDYTFSDVIGIVGEVRRHLELDPYVEKIKIQCERDFHKIFVVEDVYEDVVGTGYDDIGGNDEGDKRGNRRKVKGWKPLYKVKPE